MQSSQAELLRAAYLSGQMSEAQWRAHIEAGDVPEVDRKATRSAAAALVEFLLAADREAGKPMESTIAILPGLEKDWQLSVPIRLLRNLQNELNGGAATFQARVWPWMLACFGEAIAMDKLERDDRFLEEVLELLQSGGYPPERVAALTNYVFGRPKGEPSQETGGVMVTLAARCLAHNVDMDQAGEAELARIWTKIEAIRAKQAAKPVGSALPVALEATASDNLRPAARRLADEVESLRKVFGAPGDHGYSTREGQALYKLYTAWADLLSALTVNAPAATPAEVTPLAGAADLIIGQIEERFSNWRSYRDLIDCIDCTLHDLRTRSEGGL